MLKGQRTIMLKDCIGNGLPNHLPGAVGLDVLNVPHVQLQGRWCRPCHDVANILSAEFKLLVLVLLLPTLARCSSRMIRICYERQDSNMECVGKLQNVLCKFDFFRFSKAHMSL